MKYQKKILFHKLDKELIRIKNLINLQINNKMILFLILFNNYNNLKKKKNKFK